MQLHASRIDYHQLFESAPGLYLILTPDLTIVAASDAYVEATLTKREEIMGKKLFEVFPDNPDDPSADGVSNLRASLDYVRKHLTSHTMAVQKYDIRRPDGVFEERFWSPLNKPVLDENGDLRLIIHRVEDVTEYVKLRQQDATRQQQADELKGRVVEAEMETFKRAQEVQALNARLLVEIQERKKAEEILATSQKMFSTIFYESPVMNTISDADTGRYIDVNENFARFCNYPKEEIIGKTFFDLQLSIDRDQRAEMVATLRSKAPVRDVMTKICNRYGDMKILSLSAHPVMIGDRLCFVAAMVDATERVRATDQLEQLNKELEAFSYSVSHDLRAPLRIVDGYSKIVLSDYQGLLDDEGRRYLGIITENVTKMGQLIDDLLNLAKLGRKEMVFQPVNMTLLVQSVLDDMFINGYSRYEVKMTELHPAVGDLNLLRQIWVNLLSNAVKYSSTREKPVIQISSEERDGEVIYCVKDNGVGFSMQYVNKLFGVFQRLHKVTEFEGTGVGLALVDRIIKRHGGKVWADAGVDKGATFYFSLPVK